jgi:hypothetical protein
MHLIEQAKSRINCIPSATALNSIPYGTLFVDYLEHIKPKYEGGMPIRKVRSMQASSLAMPLLLPKLRQI